MTEPNQDLAAEELLQRITDGIQAQQEDFHGQFLEQQKIASEIQQQMQEIELQLAQQEQIEAEQTAPTAEEIAIEEQDAQETSAPLSAEELASALESILFVSEKPVSMRRLEEIFSESGTSKEAIEAALLSIQIRMATSFHGVELATVAGGYQFRTKPEKAPWVRKLAKIQVQRLSKGAMETLAIVAYRQPVMKEEVDEIRGVDSSHFIRTLLDRKLVEIAGRSELPGKPILYATTPDFLEIFGINHVTDLPPLREVESMIPASESENPEDQLEKDPKIRQIRKLVQEMKADQTRIHYDPKEDEKFLKEIREKVKSILISTPTLDQIKAEAEAEAQQQKLDQTTEQPIDLTISSTAVEQPSLLAEEPPPISL